MLISKIIKFLSILALALILIMIGLLLFDYFSFRNSFPAKTYVGNVNVSFLSREQAIAKIKHLPLEKIFAATVTLEADKNSFSFSPSQLGIFVHPQESVDNAFRLTHSGNYFVDVKTRLTLKGAQRAPLALDLDKAQLRAVLIELVPQVNTNSKDAAVVFFEETGGYHIFAEELGRILLVEESLTTFEAALSKGATNIPLAIEYIEPHIRENKLRANPPVYRTAAYTTYYGSHDSPNRIHNIKLVASWVDGTILMPGDKFSVAKILGKVTKERGFKEAFVIVGGQLEPLLGGGSCQIATTLYNAVSLADLKVIKRTNHSLYFNIYPLGRDAGVYPGVLDMIFENDTLFPILIKTVATNQKLSFRIYGTPTGKEVKFSAPAVYGKTKSGQYQPMSLKYVIDHDLPFRTVVMRTVSDEAGQTLKQEAITSYYRMYGEKSNVPIKRPEPR